MKGLIRKEWYSLWSQYRIHMLAMLGLGILLPLLKDTDFFFDELFWMYCAALTILYILMQSIKSEEISKWNMYRATLPINGREVILSKYIFGFGTMVIATILFLVGILICQEIIVGKVNIYLIRRTVKTIWVVSTQQMAVVLPILYYNKEYDKGEKIIWPVIVIIIIYSSFKMNHLLVNLPFPTIVLFVLLFIVWCLSGVLSCKFYEKRKN